MGEFVGWTVEWCTAPLSGVEEPNAKFHLVWHSQFSGPTGQDRIASRAGAPGSDERFAIEVNEDASKQLARDCLFEVPDVLEAQS
jgi:hypothetical protein